MNNLLEVKNLEVSFYGDFGETKAVKEVSFFINKGEVLGIVGESGSGKSVATKTILRLCSSNSKIKKGSVLLEGTDLLSKTERELQEIRGNEISLIFQDSQSALNPVYTIGNKLVELIRRHHKMSKKQAVMRAIELLNSVGITDAKKHMDSYPHELSGGMRQRVMIAMAMSSNPKIIIADEPTTALDVTIQAQILHLLRELQRRTGMSILMITHDLGVVAQLCSRIAVMCGGYIVEEGTTEDIFYNPMHPYTQALLASMPKLGKEFEQLTEKNKVEDNDRNLCPFLSRCNFAKRPCGIHLPEMYPVNENHHVRCHRGRESIGGLFN